VAETTVKKTSVLRVSTHCQSDATSLSMLVEDMPRNIFFAGWNITCYTFYIHLWRTWSPLLCWSEFLATVPEIPGSIPALPYFLRRSGSVTGSTQPREDIEEILEWKISGSGSRKSRLTTVEIRCADHALSVKVGTSFADIRRSLCRYSLLAD
jgi:hypothetical protein